MCSVLQAATSSDQTQRKNAENTLKQASRAALRFLLRPDYVAPSPPSVPGAPPLACARRPGHYPDHNMFGPLLARTLTAWKSSWKSPGLHVVCAHEGKVGRQLCRQQHQDVISKAVELPHRVGCLGCAISAPAGAVMHA